MFFPRNVTEAPTKLQWGDSDRFSMVLREKLEHEKWILVEGCVWLTHLKLDFGAHTLCVSSTHEYYSNTKYQLQSTS